MDTATQMLLYSSVLHTVLDDDSTSVNTVNSGPINATPEMIINLIILFIISLIFCLIIFHFINRKVDREFKEMQEYNKNNKDGYRISWE